VTTKRLVFFGPRENFLGAIVFLGRSQDGPRRVRLADFAPCSELNPCPPSADCRQGRGVLRRAVPQPEERGCRGLQRAPLWNPFASGGVRSPVQDNEHRRTRETKSPAVKPGTLVLLSIFQQKTQTA
jgi:hypothetical protein